MGRQNQQFQEREAYLAQLLALNAMLDAARAGEAARDDAKLVASVNKAVNQTLSSDSLIDPESDAHLQFFYTELLDAAERPPRLS